MKEAIAKSYIFHKAPLADSNTSELLKGLANI